MTKYFGIELVEKLSLEFGPSGCESRVAELIISQIQDDCDAYYKDRNGNVVAKLCGCGADYNKAAPRKLMLSAHMDEVGVMINEITEDGYIKFSTVGGIDPRVLCGRAVVLGDEDRRYKGVIASKAIHMQSAEERTKVTPIKNMYIDIGAKSKDEAEQYVGIGDVGVFDSDFVRFGTDNVKMKCKALDDRMGCATLIEVMRMLKDGKCEIPYDVYFAFTCGEEIGISGAQVAAQTIEPDVAVVIETTAVADIAGVGEQRNVAIQGEGGAISLMDRSTIYDAKFVQSVMDYAATCEIPAQIKRYVSGGNDAGHIHKAGRGVKTLAISAPTRYLHSQSCVVDTRDFESINKLLFTLIRDAKL